MTPPETASAPGLWSAINRRAREAPRRIALSPGMHSPGRKLRYGELMDAIDRRVAELEDALGPGRHALGLLADNGIDWVLADLAGLRGGHVLTPLPGFFTDEQRAHVTEQARLSALITDQPQRLSAALPGNWTPRGRLGSLHLLARNEEAPHPAPVPAGVVKRTFTSGTTGSPRGIALDAQLPLTVAASIARAIDARPGDVHLCVMPLCVLLENVGGVYRSLLAGGALVVPRLDQVGLNGSSTVDPAPLARSLASHRAQVAIFVPAVLQALIEYLEHTGLRLPALRFAGVGGAPVPGTLLARARACGLPVFEGYGLTEAASVVSLNRPGACRAGSVGRPLDHLDVSIAPDGEILVGGLSGASEPGRQHAATSTLATGDLGHVDEQGFLFVHGRKCRVIVTAHGRNVSPEWVERMLQAQPSIARAAVVGHGHPHLGAVIQPAGQDSNGVAAAVEAVNAGLPDYARIATWALARRPFGLGTGELTASGEPRRDILEQAYATELFHPHRARELIVP